MIERPCKREMSVRVQARWRPDDMAEDADSGVAFVSFVLVRLFVSAGALFSVRKFRVLASREVKGIFSDLWLQRDMFHVDNVI